MFRGKLVKMIRDASTILFNRKLDRSYYIGVMN